MRITFPLVRSRVVAVTVIAAVFVALGVAVSAPVRAAETLDQDKSTPLTNSNPIATPSNPMSQAVTPGLSGPLRRAVVYLQSSGTAPSSVTLGVYAATTSGNTIYRIPTGNALATATITSPTLTAGTLTFDFEYPYAVSAGTPVVLVLTPAGGNYIWKTTSNTAGPDVSAGKYNTWFPNNPWVQAFQTYVDVPASISAEPSQIPDSIFQQLPASANGCRSVDDSGANWAGVASGSWTPSWAQWANGGIGGPVCSRWLHYDDGRGRWFSSSS